MPDSGIRINDDDEGLLPIGIVAIVIGCVGALVLFIVLLFFCCFRSRSRTENNWNCCAWGRRRIIVLRRKASKPKVQYVERPQPQVVVREKPCPPPQQIIIREKAPAIREMSGVYTMPAYLRGQHMRPWISADRRQRLIRVNGSLGHNMTMPRPAIMPAPAPAPAPALMPPDNIPMAYLQRGGALRLTTMQEDMVPRVNGNHGTSVLSQGSSVLSPADQEPGRFTIVGSSCAQNGTQSATTGLANTAVYQQQAPSVVYQPPSPTIVNPSYDFAATYQPPPPATYQQQPAATYQQQPAATYEIGTAQIGNGFTGNGFSGPGSATINVVATGDACRAPVVLDPYSLVENPATDGAGQIYVHGDCNPVRYM